jgi:phosphoenolpyruvate carboxylase
MAADDHPHKPLRDDVRLLGELLGDALRAHAGPDTAGIDDLFDRVERVRALAKDARARTGDAGDFEQLSRLLAEMPLPAALPVARAFAHFLTLANIAEQHHRVRRRRDHARDPAGAPQRGSCEEAFARLRASVPAERLADAVNSLQIELVLTAHPTEIVRRTLIQTHRRIAETLEYRNRPDLTPAEREESLDALRRDIATAWQTDEMRERPVSPLDEVRAGLVVFEQTLWSALPEYLRAADRALRAATGRALPLDATPIRFGSWIGGDRDGNPSVTPEVTRQASWLARWQAANLYLRDVQALRAELSLMPATDDFRRRADGAREPYRAVLRGACDRLEATRAWAVASLEGEPAPSAAPEVEPYFDVDEFAEPLRACAESLEATGNHLIAAGRLADILRRVAAFGLTLARLDLRQDAMRHAETLEWIDSIGRLGRDSGYRDAREDRRLAILVRELTTGSLSIADLPTASAPDRVRDVLETFQMAARLRPDSLGAYVITMASRPSDVLAVELLQQAAGSRHPQRIVPLFETADDLTRAGGVLTALFGVPCYRARIRDRQEVMVGYSDSAKDAGRFAAAWALYEAQEQIVAAGRRHGVRVVLFHGRGGSIGRGGGPTDLAIRSQPPGSVCGALRVTEQGEMIEEKFGLVDIALRTLEVYTTSTLEATLAPATGPQPQWRECMHRLSERARATYRRIVYEDPRFLDYFRAATPEPELRAIHIGSRPSRRPPAASGDHDGVASLRAIPWQFAWTQTRLLLASWLGVEDALGEALARGEADTLRAMYQGWPFFRSTLDLLEIVLAKTDARIAAQYDRRLVPADLQVLGRDLRSRLDRAIAAVLQVTGHRELLEKNAVLRQAIDVRNPYVDPINLVQIELLRRLRSSPEDPQLRRAFGVTVNGIAAGMRNTG